ncbi:hypothetical protein THAOC_17401, partial [Thalassiosira oceanica]
GRAAEGGDRGIRAAGRQAADQVGGREGREGAEAGPGSRLRRRPPGLHRAEAEPVEEPVPRAERDSDVPVVDQVVVVQEEPLGEEEVPGQAAPGGDERFGTLEGDLRDPEPQVRLDPFFRLSTMFLTNSRKNAFFDVTEYSSSLSQPEEDLLAVRRPRSPPRDLLGDPGSGLPARGARRAPSRSRRTGSCSRTSPGPAARRSGRGGGSVPGSPPRAHSPCPATTRAR